MLRRAGIVFAAVAAAGAAVFVLASLVAIVTADVAPAGFRRPPPPPPVGAFRDGGAPRHDAAIEDVLANDLPRLAGHALSDDAGRRARADALRAHPAFGRHGPALAEAWRELVDAIRRWRERGASDRETLAELRARVDVVSDELAAHDLGYYLEPVLVAERRRAGVYGYRVDDVAFVRVDDDRVRVLGVRRLDRLDDGVAALGLTTVELDDPIVLLDQVEAKVRDQILPVLAGRPFHLGADRAAALAAGDAIRRELHVALGADRDDPERAAARVRRLVTASVRHHEAQHARDQDRRLRYPDALAAYAGASATTRFAVRARHELSAYLGQLARDTWLPQLTLWNLSRHAFRGTPRVEEAVVAAVVLEALARELGISTPPLLAGGTLDRARAAALVAPLAARSTSELRGAAATAWQRLFGERLPRIVDETSPAAGAAR